MTDYVVASRVRLLKKFSSNSFKTKIGSDAIEVLDDFIAWFMIDNASKLPMSATHNELISRLSDDVVTMMEEKLSEHTILLLHLQSWNNLTSSHQE